VCGITVVAALALSACGGDDEAGDGGAASEGSSQEAVNIAHFGAQVSSPFVPAMNEAINATAKEMGAGKVELFDAANDPQKQLQQCQDAIASQRFKVFLLHPVVGNTLVSCAQDAVDAEIAVVTMGSSVGPEEDQLEPHVEGVAGVTLQNHTTYGEGLAQLTKDACADADPCNVVYQFGPPTFGLVADARKTFKEQVKGTPSIKVVAEGSHGFVPDKAVSLTKQQLQAHPDVNVITSDDDITAVAILDTLKDMGKDDEIKVIGGGGAKEAIDSICEGELFGTTVLTPRSEGAKAAEIGIKAARGEDPGETSFDSAKDLSSIGPIATKENACEFEAEWTATTG
jgi:ribose transport system substrate-binding protein